MPTLLAIDDETAVLDCYRLLFRAPEVTLLTATSGAEGVEKAAAHRPDVILLDVDLPDQSGLQIFRQIHQRDPKILIIFVTGRGTTADAIQAMSLGAYEYLLKPVEFDKLTELVTRAFEVSRLMRTPALVGDSPAVAGTSEQLVGRCPAMQEVYKSIGRVAPQGVTVLILGESGTGKELVARAIYHYSRRSAHPFLAINCAAIPETLLESELFGHEKGAFTGADRRRIGKFEQCHGGTLFLDEIGDMSPLTQTKLLRVLQEQRFERVGGNETIQTDVRLIAATNRDLGQLAASGRFRQDLFYRINVYTIQLPPLRERGEDLPLLVDHFLKKFCRELGKSVHGAAPETLELLGRYNWPGNVRELQSVLKQALLQTTGPVLLPEFLPAFLRAPHEPGTRGAPRQPAGAAAVDLEQFIQERWQAGSQNAYAECLALIERPLFQRALHLTKGNLSQTARFLGIHRGTLRARLSALGIKLERGTALEDEPGE